MPMELIEKCRWNPRFEALETQNGRGAFAPLRKTSAASLWTAALAGTKQRNRTDDYFGVKALLAVKVPLQNSTMSFEVEEGDRSEV